MSKKVKQVVVPLNVEPRLLTVQAAAAYLGTTVWFIRSLVWSKKLPYLKLGKRFVFDRADLDAWVEKAKRAA